MLHLRLAPSLLIFTSLYACAWASDVVLKPVLKNVEGVPSADLDLIVQDVNKTSSGELDELAERVRFAFQKHGYFKVQVVGPVMPTAAEVDNKKVIPVTVVVTAGEKYRIRHIGFSSSNVFSPSELRAAFPFNDGDVFDRERVGHGLENIRRLYGDKGYVNFSAVPETDVDEAARTISINVDLDEGSLFHLGTLTIRGEESRPGARDKLLNVWKAYEGRVYDTQFLKRFLNDLHARPGIDPDQVFEVSQDTEKRQVNVYIYLARPIF